MVSDSEVERAQNKQQDGGGSRSGEDLSLSSNDSSSDESSEEDEGAPQNTRSGKVVWTAALKSAFERGVLTCFLHSLPSIADLFRFSSFLSGLRLIPYLSSRNVKVGKYTAGRNGLVMEYIRRQTGTMLSTTAFREYQKKMIEAAAGDEDRSSPFSPLVARFSLADLLLFDRSCRHPWFRRRLQLDRRKRLVDRSGKRLLPLGQASHGHQRNRRSLARSTFEREADEASQRRCVFERERIGSRIE
jgi:hypothetical protein